MSPLADEVQAIQGKLGQSPIGMPAVVGVLPDNQLRDQHQEGLFAADVAAGGAGFRTEIALQNRAQNAAEAYRITEMWVNMPAAGAVELVSAGVAAMAGYTDCIITECDLLVKGGTSLTRNSSLFGMTKNTAAALGSTTRLIGQSGPNFIAIPTINVWVLLPGKIFLRSIRGGGGTLMVRPSADNLGLRFMCRWERLEKRRL